MCRKKSFALQLLLSLLCSAELLFKFEVNASQTVSISLQDFMMSSRDDNLNDSTAAVNIIVPAGNNTLWSELNLSSISSVTLQGDHYYSSLSCDSGVSLRFSNISSYVSITNLVLLGCKKIQANFVKVFRINSCIFGSENGSSSTIDLISVTAFIANTSFFGLTENDTDEIMINSSVSNVTVVLTMCKFVTHNGRALFADKGGEVNILNSTFCDSTVTKKGDHPALIQLLNVSVTMESCTVRSNSGSLIISARYCPNLTITNSNFVRNKAWECTLCVYKSNLTLQNISITENEGTFSIMYVVKSNITANGLKFIKNKGCIFVRGSLTILKGSNSFEKCLQQKNETQPAYYYAEGTFTIIMSKVKLYGSTYVLENKSDRSGGGLYVSKSRIKLYGSLTVEKNSATNGGGAFFYLTDIHIILCSGNASLVKFSQNTAQNVGGGIQAISTSITMRDSIQRLNKPRRGVLQIDGNKAKIGGGMYLEVNSKFYGYRSRTFNYNAEFQGNCASDKGGAIYVNDSTYPGVCSSSSFKNYSLQTECFFQALHNDEDGGVPWSTEHNIVLHFSNNTAASGSALYGGLLDRCTVNPLADVYDETLHSTKKVAPLHGVLYFRTISSMNDYESEQISSDALRICICQENNVNCTSKHLPGINVRKGEAFSITVAAVNQLNQSVDNYIVRIGSFVANKRGTLRAGQELQQFNTSNKECITNLTYNIYSADDEVELVLYVYENPCMRSGLSYSSVHIRFTECTCPIGFVRDTDYNKTCKCVCHNDIKNFVKKCNPDNRTFLKTQNTWIGYINESLTDAEYLVYPNCPYDFCAPPMSVNITLHGSHMADAQCAYNRTGLLCGRCKGSLQLSMGTPRCIECSNSSIGGAYSWNIIGGGICGIILIVAIMILNLTVAKGTLNGLVFYGNIILMCRSTFLPFESPNFFTIFVHLLNTQLGSDRCFPREIDEYGKLWHRIIFPAYMLFLVVIVIIFSKYFSKCAQLIGKRNPVATLATVILLVYGELLQVVIDAFSFAILKYKNKPYQIVWRPDASVEYLKGKHIALFLAALVIVAVGLVYTCILFSWQWLTRLSNFYLLRWTKNTKLTSFIDAYHAPYKPKHRYWTGLLLFIRIILNLAVTANTSGNPQYNLLTIIVSTVLLLLLKAYISGNIYKQKQLDWFESTCYFNLLLLSLLSLKSIGSHKSQRFVFNFSVSVAFVMTVCILLYHIHRTLCEIKFYKRTCTWISSRAHWRIRREPLDHLLGNNNTMVYCKETSTEVSFSNAINEDSVHIKELHGSAEKKGVHLSYLREPLLEETCT